IVDADSATAVDVFEPKARSNHRRRSPRAAPDLLSHRVICPAGEGGSTASDPIVAGHDQLPRAGELQNRPRIKLAIPGSDTDCQHSRQVIGLICCESVVAVVSTALNQVIQYHSRPIY